MLFKNCAFLAATAALVMSCLTTKNAATTSAPKGEVIFFDDFSGKNLDRSKWNAVITGMHVNDELQAYVDSPSVIAIVHGAEAQGAGNGALQLTPRYAPNFKTFDGKQFDFISGRINSENKFDFTYGTAEARIKMSAGDGLWPAWWALGYGNWPACGEIDIMEFIGEADWASAAIHGPGYSGETPFVDRFYFDKGNDVTQWHIYAVEWTPNALLFKYDGKVMFRVTRAMAEHYGKWAFDNKKYLILNYALGGAYPVKINGIKKPYYGLPQSSVDMIKKGEAKMLIDWVRVTKTQ